MCVKVNKYIEVIYLLTDDLYPALNSLFNELSHNPISEELRKELNSLELYERKLIFPSILSLFNKTTEKTYSPNIFEIVSLTQAKEEKIKQQLLLLQDSMQLPTTNDAENSGLNEGVYIQRVINLFQKIYFPTKENWFKLLKELDPEKAACKNREAGKCKCGKHFKEAMNNSEAVVSDK